MKKTPIPLIVNPIAGRGRARHSTASICSLLADRGIAYELMHSNAAGDIEYKVLAAASAGAQRIIVAGGDSRRSTELCNLPGQPPLQCYR